MGNLLWRLLNTTREMIIGDHLIKTFRHRNSALRAKTISPYGSKFSLYLPTVRLFGQQLISQEILLLPLIYLRVRAKVSNIEACLGKSSYNWFPEKGCANDTVFRLLSFPPPPAVPRVIHVGPCSRARLENSRWGAKEESSSWNYCCPITSTFSALLM